MQPKLYTTRTGEFSASPRIIVFRNAFCENLYSYMQLEWGIDNRKF
jgi:hypothetical protein